MTSKTARANTSLRKEQRIAHCHWMIKETAQAMAHECYAAMMQRNDWYAQWKEAYPGRDSDWLEDRWVKWKWGDFIDGARAILAESLSKPMDEDLKFQIYDALLKDNTLIRGRKQEQFLMQ